MLKEFRSFLMRGNIIGSHPILPHSFTYQGSNSSFQRALMSRIETAPSENSQPAHGRYRFTYAILSKTIPSRVRV